MSSILIEGGTIVGEGRKFAGWIEVEGDRISAIGEGRYEGVFHGRRIDARGMFVMPGVIDDQVHFRDPGLTYKGDMRTESLAAVAGGVTSYMEMPNTKPATTTPEALESKFERAAGVSAANYSFYFGATNDNLEEIKRVDAKSVCGIKLFMGSSTGDMLVDDERALAAIFAESPTLIATHCEYEPMIRAAADEYRSRYGNDVKPSMHPLIRSAEACYRSSAHAVGLADRYGSDLHVLHLTTGRELSLFDDKPLREKKITNEVCVHHLWFSDKDYESKGNLIKWNPAIKSAADRTALREGLLSGKVDVVATDHAPHTIDEKERPYWGCPSGGPLVQHSLVMMMEMAERGLWSVENVVEKMCHAPAVRFRVKERGFLRVGYYADIAIVDPSSPWTVKKENILCKCGWSPLEGATFASSVAYTVINGRVVNDRGALDQDFRGAALAFDR